MNGIDEPCVICLQTSTLAFETIKQHITCECKVYAHRECWKSYIVHTPTTPCPICRRTTIVNPMQEACREPPLVVLEERKSYYAGDNPQVQCLICCCLGYFIGIAVVGAIFG